MSSYNSSACVQTVYGHIWYGHGQNPKVLDAILSTWMEKHNVLVVVSTWNRSPLGCTTGYVKLLH